VYTLYFYVSGSQTFLAQPKSELGEHFAIQASNSVFQHERMIVWMIFGSKLLRSFNFLTRTLRDTFFEPSRPVFGSRPRLRELPQNISIPLQHSGVKHSTLKLQRETHSTRRLRSKTYGTLRHRRSQKLKLAAPRLEQLIKLTEHCDNRFTHSMLQIIW